ncbi:conserved hypothetical protein [Shewanella denitrificans OS217]|uniref:DUF2141 domain-containing protein n=2 Tax=Shewanella TaxID=22 RepID=Q12JP5_SHEDO|nr:conserved hypothetical protein [Shewanella denitrificans OS217]
MKANNSSNSNSKKNTYISALTLLGLSLCGGIAHGHTLNLVVDNIPKHTGQLMIQIFDSKEKYDSGRGAFISALTPVTQTRHEIVFSQLPTADYAVRIVHDENGNGSLDVNFLGVPLEGYGFSNDAGSLGPASFEDAKVGIDSDIELIIHIR